MSERGTYEDVEAVLEEFQVVEVDHAPVHSVRVEVVTDGPGRAEQSVVEHLEELGRMAFLCTNNGHICGYTLAAIKIDIGLTVFHRRLPGSGCWQGPA